MQEEIEALTQQIHALDALISDVKAQPLTQSYQVTHVDLPERSYLYRAYTGNYDQMGAVVNELYQAAKAHVAGPLFMLDQVLTDAQVYQIGLPVTPHKATAVLAKQQGIHVQHRGSYANIGTAYKCLIDYASKENLATEELFFVQFTKGPGKLFKGNVKAYLTDITLLLTN